jgi:hypothetical protein
VINVKKISVEISKKSVPIMAKDITQDLLRYRDIARLVWNFGFLPNPRLRSWYAVEMYDQCMAQLFDSMVLSLLGVPAISGDSSPTARAFPILVQPKHPGMEMEILVNQNEQSNPGRVWGRPTLSLQQGDHQLRFVGFFDWDLLGPRDLVLVEVEIISITSYPGLTGRHGLVRAENCRFLGELFTRNGRRSIERDYSTPPEKRRRSAQGGMA